MKNFLSITVLLFLTGYACADTFYVGGKELDIPAPPGFSRITQQMDAIYRLSQQVADPVNDQLAYYIAESDIPAAMSGEFPPLERYYILKVNKNLKNMTVSSKDFSELKTITKRQNDTIFKSIETQMSSIMENTGKDISKEFDINIAVQLSQMVPLDPHYETNNAIAHSMYLNFGVSAEGAKEDFILAATATYVNVAGKVLFLYCYGQQKDLEWTRNASKDWANMVMSSNSQPPSHTSGSRGMNWNKVFEKGVVGAIVGGLIALIFGAFSILKKKK